MSDEQKSDVKTEEKPKVSSSSNQDTMAMLDKTFGSGSSVQLPKEAKDWIAQYAWIFAVLGAVFQALGVLGLLGLGAMFGPLAAVTGTFSFFSVVGIGALVLGLNAVLLFLAVPGLKAMRADGWKYAFYAEVVGIVGSLLSYNFVGAVVSAVIGFFILFQIRDRFKKA